MIWQPLVRTVCTSAAYGYALGASHSGLYAARNLVKVPLLFLATAAICSVGYWVVTRAVGGRVSFTATQDLTWRLFADVATMAASLAPPVLLVALAARQSDDGHLGQYDLFLFANVSIIALSGGLAVLRHAHSLRETLHLRLAATLPLVGAWLALSLFTGGQVAFLLRPYVGLPATRGGRPPWFLWNQPDLRGARNFYAAVAQTLSAAPLAAPAERR